MLYYGVVLHITGDVTQIPILVRAAGQLLMYQLTYVLLSRKAFSNASGN